MNSGVFLSKKDDWRTPRHIIASVVEVMCGIDLDPCADKEKQVPADFHYTKKDNGLRKKWHGRVFMNPPYGKKVSKWAKKWREEYEAHHFYSGIALVAARTDTKWWRDLISTASVVCFVNGRVKFGNSAGEEKTPSTFPTAILYACRDDPIEISEFVKVFSKYGNIWVKYGVE